jgi:tetratricopeptide (TPR) repeat protein
MTGILIMTFTINLFKNTGDISSATFTSLVLIFLLGFSLSTQATNQTLNSAELALNDKQFEQAETLYKSLLENQELKTDALFGLAKSALYQQQLDNAEEYIEQVIEANPNNPNHWYIAGRIAGKQAQSASIFSKFGYAKDSKNYFKKALELDPQHTPSLIGLITFNQQAPAIAGGDKGAVDGLIKQLNVADKRAAFPYIAEKLFQQDNINQVTTLYNQALSDWHKTHHNKEDINQSQFKIDVARFKFDFAMMLSNHQHYDLALSELLSIDLENDQLQADFSTMRLYQIGKTAAESNSNLTQGFVSMTRYAALPAADKTIPKDWVDYRLAQLQFLQDSDKDNRNALIKLSKASSDKDLKRRIKSLLKSRPEND